MTGGLGGAGSHTRALNWAWREVVLRRWRGARVLVLDPDAFLVRPFSAVSPFAARHGTLDVGLAPPRCDLVGLHQVALPARRRERGRGRGRGRYIYVYIWVLLRND